MTEKNLKPKKSKLIIITAVFLIFIIIAGLILRFIVFPMNRDIVDSNYVPDKIIDHVDASRIKYYLENNEDTVNKISEYNWLFAHASVGTDMIGGMKLLNDSNPEIFPLIIEPSLEKITSKLNPGRIYEIPRGNPGVTKKFELFHDYISERNWGSFVDIAINKFCYIDIPKYDYSKTTEQNAQIAENLATQYIENYTDLENEFSNVKFIYMTMPITKNNDIPNFMRICFNQKIREHCKSSGAFLFDIADIQCHDLDENKKEFSLDSLPLESLYSLNYRPEGMIDSYTWDGGHLNHLGKQRVAKAWYALAAAIALS